MNILSRGAAARAALAAALLASGGLARAEVVRYDLTVSTKTADFTGRPAAALAVNGSIPGPTLYFHRGDTAVLRVRNGLPAGHAPVGNNAVLIHWHGMLVPNPMDGVPGLTSPAIPPGGTFTYRFPIRQRGTYWYHSHVGFHEQRGVIGAIVIKSRKPRYNADLDAPVVLSDWTDENPRRVLHDLKRGDDWYSIKKGTKQSLWGAWRRGELGAYFEREIMRMPPMDDSDVYYPRFLANGHPRIRLKAKPGDMARLRLIDGSASTFFYLQFAGGPMRIISADGRRVEPIREERFLISIAETYDVLVKVPPGGSYELRATAQDGSGHASIWLGQGPPHPAPDVPKPDLYHNMMPLSFKTVFALTPAGSMGMSGAAVKAGKFDHPGMAGMSGMQGMSDMSGMDMSDMPPAPEKSKSRYAVDGGARRPFPPYARLRAPHSTALPKGRPWRAYRLTLDGDMTRYVWMIGGKVLSPKDSIRVRKGDNVRFILINRTMMHHPMHLHGHFFRVLNGQGDYSPLKHTVDVPPMSTVVIEFPADDAGDWFFHCHILYHMMSGMARVVHYAGWRPDRATMAARRGFYHDPFYFFGRASALSDKAQGRMTLSNTWNIFQVDAETGWAEVPKPDWEATATYGRYINRFLTLFIGGDFDKDRRFQNSSVEKNVVAGLDYLLPFSVSARAWADSSGGGRAVLRRSVQLTPRLDLDGRAEYDTRDLWIASADLNVRLSRSFFLEGGWDSQYGWGAGLRWQW